MKYPWGEVHALPTCSTLRGRAVRSRLFGQEHVQNAVYRVLRSFMPSQPPRTADAPAPDRRLAVDVGWAPSATSIEHYSTLEEGALYRFSASEYLRRRSPRVVASASAGSPAMRRPCRTRSIRSPICRTIRIDARLGDELRDRPLLLVPIRKAQAQER